MRWRWLRSGLPWATAAALGIGISCACEPRGGDAQAPMPEREPIADDAATQIARNAAREVDYSIEKHEIRILRHGEVIQVEFVPVHPGRIGGGLAVYLAAASGKVLDVVHRQ